LRLQELHGGIQIARKKCISGESKMNKNRTDKSTNTGNKNKKENQKDYNKDENKKK
jgi:hypothetical protein